ncbi:MAG: hypothetical protein H6945_11630 [Zoogloeaceae bacterium]|nr:hypothetical protein [Rhodocyclaceae bacterium]MCP5236376.1 hypothetical protein [Zoogloeaceae bacterium]
MKHRSGQIARWRTRLLVATMMASGPALAERPMSVDDAGTLPRGGAKVEAGLRA